MRILLLHTPVTYDLMPYFQSESLGLGYLASVLRRDGHEVQILDGLLRGLSPDQTAQEVLTRDFDCLGITASHEQKRVLMHVARAVREKRRNAIICAGGYLPSLSTEGLLSACPELDFVVRGEGEVTACDVFGRISRNEDWHDAPGLAYVRDGELVINPVPPPIQDLDSLPFPARDAMRDAGQSLSVRIAGSRGCYHRCSFCCIQSMYRLSGQRAPRVRSPKNIVDEMETIVATTGARDFRFIDDDFLGPNEKTQQRAVAIADEIKARKLKVTLAIECRPDEVTKDTLMALKDAGLDEVFLGIESGVQRQLDTFGKHATVEQNRRGIQIVRDCGIKLRSGFMLFDPYVTVPELLENIQFLNETGIAEETTRITPVPFVTKTYLYQGVPMVSQVKQDGLLRDDDNGMDIDYVFKDRWVRIIYYLLLKLGAWSGFFKVLRGKDADQSKNPPM